MAIKSTINACNLKACYTALRSAATVHEICDIASAFLRQLGFERMMYTRIRDASPLPAFTRLELVCCGYSPDVSVKYNREWALADPTSAYLSTNFWPISWETHPLGETDMYQFLRSCYDAPGWTIPVFGPRASKGYGIVQAANPDGVDEANLNEAHMLCSVLHLRFTELLTRDAREPPILLSPREKEVVSQIMLGLQNKEIARKLDITPNTVDTFVRRIYEKLNVNDRASLAILAITTDLMEQEAA